MTEIAQEQAVLEAAVETGPYDQFILFGDSITQQACSQALGFAFQPALQDGKEFFCIGSCVNLLTYYCLSLCLNFMFTPSLPFPSAFLFDSISIS